jgi:hypothetical protein
MYFCHRKSSVYFDGKICWAKFWALLSQNHLVTLPESHQRIPFRLASLFLK